MTQLVEAHPRSMADVSVDDTWRSESMRQARLPLPIPRPVRRTPVAGSEPAVDPLALLQGIVCGVPDLFALTALGHTMQDALVHDGDVVLLQRAADVRSGELAAVRLADDGRPVLRRVYFEADAVILQPENRRIAPETLRRSEVTIEGRVIAIARREPCRRTPAAAGVPAPMSLPVHV